MKKEIRQLIVRCEPQLIHRLKILAAFDDTSMAHITRRALEKEVLVRREDDLELDAALKASDL